MANGDPLSSTLQLSHLRGERFSSAWRILSTQPQLGLPPTVTEARRQRIAIGDLIIGQRNDSTMRNSQAEHDVPAADPVRNGNCWRVAAVDADRNRIATRRLSDGPAIFGGDNMREHITDGNAVTVHAAQGVTADTSHAVLGENASRAALYMAMARVRESNNAYRYQHEAEASEYGDARPDGLHVPPSSSGKSSPPMRAHRPHTNSPPKPVETVCTRVPALLIDRRTHCGHARRSTYRQRCSKAVEKQFAEVAVLLARAITASRYRRGCSAVGAEALPSMVCTLRSIDVYSAWMGGCLQ